MIEQIALRQGLGALLADGTARAAKKMGPASEEFALHIKGQELPMHEPRWKQGMGVGYSMSPTGADHMHNMHDSAYTSLTPLLKQFKTVGILEPLPTSDLSPAKIQLLIYDSHWRHFLNCAVCCYFVMIHGLVGFERMAQLVSAVTGWNISVFELMQVGERAATLARAFNLREGFTSHDDNMPPRFFTPHISGPLQGIALNREAFCKAKEIYYNMMDWPQGSPSSGKLTELGIEWVTSLMQAE